MSDTVAIEVRLTPRTHMLSDTREGSITLDGLVRIVFSDDFGEIGQAETAEKLADYAWAVAEAARERDLPRPTVLPDGLEPATLEEAIAGWAPGELVEGFGK